MKIIELNVFVYFRTAKGIQCCLCFSFGTDDLQFQGFNFESTFGSRLGPTQASVTVGQQQQQLLELQQQLQQQQQKLQQQQQQQTVEVLR